MKIVVLMGGTTAEREISLSTGSGVAAALRRLGHEVVSIDAANGRLLTPGEEPESAAGQIESTAGGTPSDLVRVPAVSEAEMVFVALHGGPGEDGTLQAVLDLAGRPYTGSGHLASGLAMSKVVSKRLFEHAGIPTPRWMALSRDGGTPELEDLEPMGGLPAVIKPNDQGSTVGLTIVEEPDQLPGAFAEAARYSDTILVETYIPGRELTVSMLGDEPLPVVEIIPEGGLYDYEHKYTPGASRYEVPAQLPTELARRIQELGQRAFRILGCSGVGRVDLRLSPDDSPYILEVNTVPGLTPTSLVPMAAQAVGISYDELVKRMVRMAEQRGRGSGGHTAAAASKSE
jgi:D-alanine-D-alanine ligase